MNPLLMSVRPSALADYSRTWSPERVGTELQLALGRFGATGSPRAAKLVGRWMCAIVTGKPWGVRYTLEDYQRIGAALEGLLAALGARHD
ncbi:MAG TPA: hypothetical protein VNL18_15665 [Gemmatimonadales bacterium]|nr:hypothetical protein [Gemmatimonadales bacterium]